MTIGENIKIQEHISQGYIPNRSEEVFLMKNLRIMYHGHRLLLIVICEKIVKKLQQTIRTEFIVKKSNKKNGVKPYVKWEGYDNCFNK